MSSLFLPRRIDSKMIEIRNIKYPKRQTVLLSNIKNTVSIINDEIKTMTTANRNKILKERDKKSIRNALIDDPIYRNNLNFSPLILKILNSAIEHGIYSKSTLKLCKGFLLDLNIHMVYLNDLTIDHPMKTYWNPFFSQVHDKMGNEIKTLVRIKIEESPNFLCFYMFINGLLDFIRYIDKAFEIVGHIPIVRSRMQNEYTSFTHPELDYKIHYQNWNSNISPRNTSEYIMLVTRERLCSLLAEHVSSMYFYELRANDIKKKFRNTPRDSINKIKGDLTDLIEDSSFFEKLQKKEMLKSSSILFDDQGSPDPNVYYNRKYYATDKSFIKVDKKIVKTRDFKKNFGKIIRVVLDKNNFNALKSLSKWLCFEMDFIDHANSMDLSDYKSTVSREAVVKHFIGMNYICSMKWKKSKIITCAIYRIIIGYKLLTHNFTIERELEGLGQKSMQNDIEEISNNIGELRYMTWIFMHDIIPLLSAIEKNKWTSDEQILSFDNGNGFCKIYPSTERTKTYDELFDPCHTLHNALKKKMIFNCKLDMMEKLFLKSMPILFEVRQYDKNLSEFSKKSSLSEVKDFILNIIKISISGLYRHNFYGNIYYTDSKKSMVDPLAMGKHSSFGAWKDDKLKGKKYYKKRVFTFNSEFNFVPDLKSKGYQSFKFNDNNRGDYVNKKNQEPGRQNYIFSQENLKFSRFVKLSEIFADSDSKNSIYDFFSSKYKLLRKIIQEYLCASLLKDDYILSCVEKFLISNKSKVETTSCSRRKMSENSISPTRKNNQTDNIKKESKPTDKTNNNDLKNENNISTPSEGFILTHGHVIKSTLKKLFMDIEITRYIMLDIAIQTVTTDDDNSGQSPGDSRLNNIIWEIAFFSLKKSKFISVIEKMNRISYIDILKFCLHCVKETHIITPLQNNSLVKDKYNESSEIAQDSRLILENYSLEKKIIQETYGPLTIKIPLKKKSKSKKLKSRSRIKSKKRKCVDKLDNSKGLQIKRLKRGSSKIKKIGIKSKGGNHTSSLGIDNQDSFYSKLRVYKLDIIDFLISNIESIDLLNIVNIFSGHISMKPKKFASEMKKEIYDCLKSITREECEKFENGIILEIKRAIPKIMKRTAKYFKERSLREKNDGLSPPGGCMYKSELSDGIKWVASEFNLNKTIIDKISDICYMYENRESSRKISSKIQEYIIYTESQNNRYNIDLDLITHKNIFNNIRDFIFVRVMLQMQKRHNQISIIPKKNMNCSTLIKCIISLQHRFKIYINSCSLSPEEYSIKIKTSLAHMDKITGIIVTNCCNRVASVTGFENFGSNYIYNTLSMEQMADMLFSNRNPFKTKYLKCCLSLSKRNKEVKKSHLSRIKKASSNGKGKDENKKSASTKNEYNLKQFIKTLCKNIDSEINECGKVFDNRVYFLDILNNNILASVSSEHCNTGEYNSKDVSKSWGSTGSSRWRLNYMFCLCHDCGCLFKRSSVYYNINEKVPNLCDRCIYIDTQNSIVSYCSFSDKIKYLSKKEAISHAVKIDKLSLMDIPIDFSINRVQGMTKFSSSQWKKTKTFEDSFMKENEKLLISRTPLVFINIFNHKTMHFEKKQISLELYLSKIFPRMTKEDNLIYLKNSEGFKEPFIYSFIYDKFNRDSIYE